MLNINIARISFVILVLKVCSGNELGSLIDEVAPFEEVKLNGDVVETGSEKVVVEKDDDGSLSATYFGKGSLSVKRSTGLPSGAAQDLLNIVRNALGSRFRLLATLKRGGRLVTLRDERRLNEILDSQKQNIEVRLKDSLVDLTKASLIETLDDSSVMEPDGSPGVRITVSREGVSVKTTSDDNDVKISVTKGLNQHQSEKLKDNFYGLVAEKASFVTGLPKPLIEVMLTGRDTTVDRLSQVLSPVERVVIGNKVVNLDQPKKKLSAETVLEPENFPKVKITWKKGDKLQVESGDGQSIYLEYSKGVAPRLIGRLVDNLHRAVTLRLGTITWSNKLLGSIPPQLESAINELKSNIQKRSIFVEGKEVDLTKASVTRTTDDYVLYRLSSGALLRVYYDGTVSTEGGESLALEITPGISETQVANVLSRMNQIFSTAIGFSTESGETLLNDESNRKMLQTLLRGIKPKERITIDDETVQFANSTISKKEPLYTEYTVDNFGDVILTKFTEGDIKVVGKGRTLKVSRSTGLTLGFLNRLVKGINSVMPRKRWFYNFGMGNKNYFRGQKLQSVIDEIPKMIQVQSVTIDDKQVDLNKATIISVDDTSTVFSTDINSDIKVTKFSNGDVQTMSTGDEVVGVKVSPGITSQDGETLINNIKSIVGDRFKIDIKRPDNFWCSTGDIRKLLNWLLNEVNPKSDIHLGNGESSDEISENLFTSLTRTVDEKDDKNGLTISEYNGKGKNITSTKGGKICVSLSTGLTEETTHELIDYLISLFENKEDVIKMVTGSMPEYRIRMIKEMIQKMIQHNSISVDTQTVTPYNAVLIEKKTSYTLYSPSGKRDVTVRNNKDGSIEIDCPNSHRVSIALSPGITQAQAEQMYRNVLSAFKHEFSDITKIPVQFLDIVSGLKKYIMKSYFYSCAPPKEFVSVNGKEIRLKNMTQVEDDAGFILKDPQELSGVTVSKLPDGTLEIVSKEGGNIDVIRTTGLNDEQINRLLKAVEFRLGLKNKLFRFSSDELFSLPDKPESLESILKSFVTSERIFIDDIEVNVGRFRKIQSYDGCSLYKSDDYPDLIVKRCEDGQVSIDYRDAGVLTLQVLPGVSQDQAKYILKNLVTTIRTKSSNIKLLTNFPDIFLQLLADGRLKSLETLVLVLIPREEVFLDGKQVKLDPANEEGEEEYQMIESDAYPGFQAVRYKNGTLQVQSWTGGRLDVTMNTGVSTELLSIIAETLKDEASEKLAPFFLVADALMQANASTIFSIVDPIIKSQNAKVNMNYVLDEVENEVKKRIHSFNIDESLIRNLVLSTVQKQDVYINDQLVNLDRASVIESKDDFVVYSPEDVDHVKITKYDCGRIVVDCLHEEPIAVRVSAGIPRKMLVSLTQNLQRLMKRLDSDEDFTKRIRAQLVSYIVTLYEAITDGISERRTILLDDQVIELSKDNEIENTDSSKVYKKDAVLVTIDAKGGTRVETTSGSKLEIVVSSGIISEPVIDFLSNNSVTLLKELLLSYQHFDTMVPLMTKMEKILEGMMSSLERKVDIYVNGKSINLSSIKMTEFTDSYRILTSGDVPGLMMKSYHEGKLIIELPDKENTLEVYISQGLSPSDLARLRDNVESMFSKINPLELVADIFDVLPKNFYILAQNMDRVLSIMNLIKI